MQEENLEVLKSRSKNAYQYGSLVLMILVFTASIYTIYQANQRRYEARSATKHMLAVMDQQATTDVEHYVADKVKQCVTRADYAAYEKSYVGLYSAINQQVYAKELNDIKNQCLVKIGDSAELLNSRGISNSVDDNAYITKMRTLLKSSL